MLKRTVTYTDFNGEERTEDAYFNFNKVEALKLSVKYGDIQAYAKDLANGSDPAKIVDMIEDIIVTGYGERSSDGRSFVKTPEITARFKGSGAYAEIFEKMVTDVDYANEFAEGIAKGVKAVKEESNETPGQTKLEIVNKD